MTPRRLTITVVYPDLLGTYGDGGNGLVLAQRARWRGIEADLLDAPSDRPVPPADLYCLGGGEDGPQVRAAEALAADGTLNGAFADGAVVLAVCAGFQIAGTSFPAADGSLRLGLGLADFTTRKGSGQRAVGEVVADPLPHPTLGPRPLPALTGFENHAGLTSLDPGTQALAAVRVGTGNGGGDATEGVAAERFIGTYLHGPVLARNPALADLLLGWALGADAPLDPIDDSTEEALRRQRIDAATRVTRARSSGRLHRALQTLRKT